MKFNFDVYCRKDISSNNHEMTLVFSGTYETTLSIDDVVNRLHSREAIIIEKISSALEIPLIRYKLIGEGCGNIADFEFILGKEFTLVSNDKGDFENATEKNYILYFGGFENSEQDRQEVNEYVNSLLKNNAREAINSTYIFEWGCSGFFQDLIIQCIAAVPAAIISSIAEYLLLKGNGNADVIYKDVTNIKDYIRKQYNISLSGLKLISIKSDQEGNERYKFSSRYLECNVKINSKGKIVESSINNLSQTRV